MKKDSKKQNKSVGLIGWVDERFPLSSFIKNHLTEYYAPKNFNFWYFLWSVSIIYICNANFNGYFLNNVLQA